MTLLKSPLAELQQFQARMAGQLEQQRHGAIEALPDEVKWQPAADLWEDEQQWVLLLELGGMEQKDIELRVEEQILEIRGERRLETPEGRIYRRLERPQGRFCRRFSLPEGTERGRVRAIFENGLLKVVLPKGDSRQPLQIEVEGNGNGV